MNDERKQEATVSQSKPSGRAHWAQSARLLIRRTKQATRRKFPAEKKIRLLLEEIRGEMGSIGVLPTGRHSLHDLLQVDEGFHGSR